MNNIKVITGLTSFILAITILLSAYNNQEGKTLGLQKGMIKVAIMYPHGENNTFDMEYYAEKHMPMAAELFGEALKGMSIDKGIANGNPEKTLPYMAIGYFYFEDMATMQQEMGAHSPTLRADVPNYTNVQPELLISEVILDI